MYYYLHSQPQQSLFTLLTPERNTQVETVNEQHFIHSDLITEKMTCCFYSGFFVVFNCILPPFP